MINFCLSCFDWWLQKRTCTAALAIILLFPSSLWASEPPWRVNNSFTLPNWLSISGQHRTRFETVDEQFRSGRNGDDQILVFRTNVLTELMVHNWKFGLEILDARQAHAKDDTPISASVVNPIDVLQVFAQWQVQHLINENSVSNFKVGRFTIDVGSR